MIDEIRAELVWCVSASEILVTADGNYFASCTFTKPYPFCQLQAAHCPLDKAPPTRLHGKTDKRMCLGLLCSPVFLPNYATLPDKTLFV
ncbi:MAG: hypothetical protein V3U56_05535, partial [Syntrophobacteria bacterium]